MISLDLFTTYNYYNTFVGFELSPSCFIWQEYNRCFWQNRVGSFVVSPLKAASTDLDSVGNTVSTGKGFLSLISGFDIADFTFSVFMFHIV